MTNMFEWRQNATAYQDQRSKPVRDGVRELRPACWHPDARDAEEEKGCGEVAEKEQSQGLAFSLSAPLAFGSLPLLALPGKPIPCKATASNLRADNSEPFCVGKFAPIVAEGLFVQIPEQMERFHADVCPVQLPFDQTPEIFHRVRVDVPTGVLYGVIYNVMPIARAQSVIGSQRITEESGTCRNILADLPMEFMFPSVRHGERADVSTTLHHSEGDGFVFTTCTGDDAVTLRAVHVAGFPTDEGFVYFDFTRPLGSGFVLHGFTNPMQHAPGCFLSQAKVTGDLATADTVPAVSHQPHRSKPFITAV